MSTVIVKTKFNSLGEYSEKTVIFSLRPISNPVVLPVLYYCFVVDLSIKPRILTTRKP